MDVYNQFRTSVHQSRLELTFEPGSLVLFFRLFHTLNYVCSVFLFRLGFRARFLTLHNTNIQSKFSRK